jgi:hypothetical protein
MGSQAPNPPLPAPVRGLTWLAAAGLLLAGGGLFFALDAAAPAWPWALDRFGAHFLGAVSLAALAAVSLLLIYPRWAPARLLLPMTFSFTAPLLLVSLAYARRFHFERVATYAWFAVCLGLPALAAYGLYRLREMPWPAAFPTPPFWRRLLLANALVMGLYGLALFAAPVTLSAFWPWEVDAFHGRLFSVVFTTLAVGGVGLAQWAAPVERLTLGLACAVLGLFSLFGVLIADAGQGLVDWSAPGAWLWLAIFVVEFVIGLGLIGWSSSAREAAT